VPVIEVTELAQSRTFRVFDTWNREATRMFRVLSNDKNMGPSYAAFAAGIPNPQDSYTTDDESDAGLKVVEVTPAQDPMNLFQWFVTVRYSSYQSADPSYTTPGLAGGGGGGGGGGGPGSPPNDSPLLEPPQASWQTIHDTATLERAWAYDAFHLKWYQNGKAVVNSAKTRFAPLPTVDQSRVQLTYSRNQLTFDFFDVLENYLDAVNETDFLGFPAGQAKLSAFTAQSFFRNNLSFWTVAYLFHFVTPDWDTRLIDQGPNILVNGKQQTFKREGMPKLTLLDGNGNAWEDEQNPKVLTFTSYPRVNFAPLNIILPP